MVSRSTGPLRTTLPAVAVGLAALLVGCGAGQVTQTDSVEPAVNGNSGDLGTIALRDVMIAYPDSGQYDEGDQASLVLTIVNTGGSDDELVDVSSPVAEDVELIGNPSLPGGTALQVIEPEASGESAPPSTTGTSAPSSEPPASGTSVPEESVTEPSAPADTGTQESGSESPSEPSEPADSEVTETPSSELAPDEVGIISIVLTLSEDLPVGRNVPVTFVFANAGQIEIELPIATPDTARIDPPETEAEGH